MELSQVKSGIKWNKGENKGENKGDNKSEEVSKVELSELSEIDLEN